MNGVYHGASLKVWEEYFPNSQIIGADIESTATQHAGGRIKITIMDQSYLEDLVRVGVKHGPFDIIIEDGSHMWEHQITTLRTLFPFVTAGGMYIVEDLETNFQRLEPKYRGNASISCVEYLKKLVDFRVADSDLDISREEDAFIRTYARARAIQFCLLGLSLPAQAGTTAMWSPRQTGVSPCEYGTA